MPKPTIITWIIIIFGLPAFLPFVGAQLVMLTKPNSIKTRNLLIGKGEDWRDKTHYKSAYAFAWADWLVIVPLFIIGNIGVITGQLWGYVLWIALGTIAIYFSIIFFIMEKKYTYPSCGPLAYYTYYWGFPLYWGIAAVTYSLILILT